MSSKQERRKKRLKKKSFTKLRDSREAIPTTSDLGVLGVGSSVFGSYAVLCTEYCVFGSYVVLCIQYSY